MYKIKYVMGYKDVAKIGIFSDNKDLSLILIFVFCIDLPKVAQIKSYSW